MRRVAPLLLSVAALVAPAGASAGIASIRSFDATPVSSATRAIASSSATRPFQLVGVHWRGAGSVELRTRGVDGRWSRWIRAHEDDDGPTLPGWRIGAPIWVGTALRVEVRARGKITRIRAFTVRSPVLRVPLRATSSAVEPAIVPRSGWLADESIRRAGPEFATALRMVHIHHTAGTNTYTRAQSPAVVRAIQLYHVKANGWNDIGYNALVDRFGTVYEGRYGGLEANVVGAHARGFNTGSFGIAVMGDFQTVAPSKAAVDALVRTLAWRLDLAHVDPLGTFTATASGNERFAEGVPVFLRVISGHRDTGLTTCPGQRLYDLIPSIAARVAATGRPKIYGPEVARDETGGIRFTASLSEGGPWVVVVSSADGTELARGEGTGSTVDWTWEGSATAEQGTRWSIQAPGARPAEGALDAAVAGDFTVASAAASPSVISPNGDGQADVATIGFTLSADANVGAVVLDEADVQVAELERPRWRRAGTRAIVFDGTGLPDGRYVVRLSANATGGRTASSDVPVAISRSLGLVRLSTATVVPSRVPLSIRFTLSAGSAAKITLLREGRWVATPVDAELAAGPRLVTWSGGRATGATRDGSYTAVVEVTDAVGTSRVELPFFVDGTPPILRVVGAAPPRLWVSEPAVVRLVINNARRRIRVPARGTFVVPGVVRLRTLVATARDAAGNVALPLRRPG